MASSQKKRNGEVERLIDAHKMWAIVCKNWMVLKGDKARLVPLFTFPLIMIVIFGYASGNVPRHLQTGIVDYDGTGLSKGVQDQLAGVDIFSIGYHVSTQDEGKKLLDEGKIKILFIIPSGFSEKVSSGESASLELMVDESDSSVAQIAKSSAGAFTQSLSQKIARERIEGLAAEAEAAQGELSGAGKLLEAPSGAGTGAQMDAIESYYQEAKGASGKSGKVISDTVRGLRNTLGYMVDQNEIAGSFPSGISENSEKAALQLLAVGDSQAATLAQIGVYQGLQATQAAIMRDAGGIYAKSREIAGQAEGNAKAAAVSLSFVQSARARAGEISMGASQALNPVELSVLEPYGYGRRGIDFLLPSILALVIFQGATMGLGRAIAGERKDGSLTRVFLTPTSNVTIILGTQLFYVLLETVRSSMIIFAAIALFGVSISGNITDIIFVIAIFAIGATGVGMVLSVITKNQEQYMAVGMLISLPMMFLSGAFFPVQTMPQVLQSIARVLPITYAANAMRGVMVKGFAPYQMVPDLLALVIFGAATLALSIMLFKREVM